MNRVTPPQSTLMAEAFVRPVGGNGRGGFLAELDGRMRGGWPRLAPHLREAVLTWLPLFAASGGGFRGRLGDADTYYTDFGVRLLDIADAPHEAFERAGQYLGARPSAHDVVDLFSRLNIGRLLGPRNITLPVPENARDILSAQVAGDGGFAHPGGAETSGYVTFLAALIFEITGEPFPSPQRTAAALRRLKRPDGGFADRAGDASSQASTTAASVATLGKLGAIEASETADAVRFLVSLQTDSGGLGAFRGAPEPDLLSTFTAVTTLAHLGALDLLRLAPLARFVLDRKMAIGFAGSPSDPDADVEYTFYGVGCLCLLQQHLAPAATA